MFELSLSSESLRVYFKEWKDEIQQIAGQRVKESDATTKDSHNICDCLIEN